jgi:hypothetical protein
MATVCLKTRTTEACERSGLSIVLHVIRLLAHRRRPASRRNFNRISRRAGEQVAATARKRRVVEIGPVADAVLPGFRGERAHPRWVTPSDEKVLAMLYTLAVVLLVLWVLGLVSSYTLGGFIHILLVIAVVMILINLINGRKSL